MLEYELQKMYHQYIWYIHILWYDDLIMYFIKNINYHTYDIKYFKVWYVYILIFYFYTHMTSSISYSQKKKLNILVVCEPILISTIYSYLATCINNSHNRNCRWGNLMLINLLLMKRGPALIWRGWTRWRVMGYSGHAE